MCVYVSVCVCVDMGIRFGVCAPRQPHLCMCVAVCYSVLQCVAVSWPTRSMDSKANSHIKCGAAWCSVVQCGAVWNSVWSLCVSSAARLCVHVRVRVRVRVSVGVRVRVSVGVRLSMYLCVCVRVLM